jgi:hypothetical protein
MKIGRSNFMRVTLMRGALVRAVVQMVCVPYVAENSSGQRLVYLDEKGATGSIDLDQAPEGIHWIRGWPHPKGKAVRALRAAFALLGEGR